MSDDPKFTEEEIEEIIGALDIKTGVGDPSSPFYGQLLSQEDENRLDPAGSPVVEGDTWGESSTGLYLTIAVTKGGFGGSSRATLGGAYTPVSLRLSSQPLTIACISTMGKPSFPVRSAGASLELPGDLARDKHKRQYVVEWIKDTAAEALALYGVDLSKDKDAYQALGLTVALMAEDAIRGTGL